MSPLFLIPPGCFALNLGIVINMLDQNLVHFKLNFNEKLPFSCFCNFAAIFKKSLSTFSQFSSNMAVAYSHHWTWDHFSESKIWTNISQYLHISFWGWNVDFVRKTAVTKQVKLWYISRPNKYFIKTQRYLIYICTVRAPS